MGTTGRAAHAVRGWRSKSSPFLAGAYGTGTVESLLREKTKGDNETVSGWCREWLIQGGGIWDARDLDGGVCDS